jgi:hypothetical protein
MRLPLRKKTEVGLDAPSFVHPAAGITLVKKAIISAADAEIA